MHEVHLSPWINCLSFWVSEQNVTEQGCQHLGIGAVVFGVFQQLFEKHAHVQEHVTMQIGQRPDHLEHDGDTPSVFATIKLTC